MLKVYRFLVALILSLGLAATARAQAPTRIEPPISRPYMVVVDCDLAKAIKNSNYTFVHDSIKKKLTSIPDCGLGTNAEVVLVAFDNPSSEEVWNRLDKMGLRPANLYEVHPLGEQFTKAREEHTVVALGSEWREPNGCVSVPVLMVVNNNDNRALYAEFSCRPHDKRWPSGFEFAAVRK